MNHLDDRWRHLVNAAFHLDESVARHEDAALSLVSSALEVFTAEVDPNHDFEGYAVRRFLLSLRGALIQRAPDTPA